MTSATVPAPTPTTAVDAPLLTPAEVAELAARAAHAPLHLRRHEVHDHAAGDWPSARLGRGLDFEEARPYAPGDDVRDMDWRSTARLGHPYVKVYREERQPTWQLVVDRGPTMRFGTRRRLKVAQAARIALWLAFQGAEQQVAVGATLWDRDDVTLPPRHGRTALLSLVARLDAPCPPQAGAATAPERDRLRLLALAAALPRGSHVWLLSDLDWLREDHVQPLGRLAASTAMRVVRLVDPAERVLPAMGRVRMVDIASGRSAWVDTARRAQREALAESLAGRRRAQDGLLARCGLQAIDVDSHLDDFDTVLARHG